MLEDPPVFSTQGEGWEESFAYLDTYKPLHDYNRSDRSECWEAYYLRHCYWGQLFMKNAMDRIADYAEHYHRTHPGEAVRIRFLPSSIWTVFEYAKDYVLLKAERAVSYIGENCRLIETPTSDHVIHTVHSALYIETINSLLKNV